MFSKVDRPVHFPGRSAVLGETRGPVVDLGVDWNGWIYLTEIESIEIGRLWGMVEGNVHDQTLARVAELEGQLEDAEAAIAELELAQPKVVALDDVAELLKPKVKPSKAAA